MNRITPEMIKEAYSISGLKPAQEKWYGKSENCGCAFTALMCSREDLREEFINLTDDSGGYEEIVNFIVKNSDYSYAYADGFIHGYDAPNKKSIYIPPQHRLNETKSNEYLLGIEDGKATALEIFKEEEAEV